MNLPTPETYDELQRAYDFFNEKLFSNELPPCLITLQREKRTYGYCSFKRFVGRESGYTVDEIPKSSLSAPVVSFLFRGYFK